MDCAYFQDIVVRPYQSGQGGVFSRSGEFIEAFTKDLRQWFFTPGEFLPPTRHIDEPAIFIGPLFNHFGHFLLESLSRIGYAKTHPELPIIWFHETSYTPWQKEILQLLDIHNRAIFVTEPTSFSQVYLPQMGFIPWQKMEPEHFETLACVAPAPMIAGKKCWISRSLLDKNVKKRSGYLLNENRLEERLIEAGWEIYHPQHHSIQEQLQYFSSCERIAGIQGSAFHLLLLLKTVHASIIIFRARGHSLLNFKYLAESRHWNQQIIELPDAKKININSPYFQSTLCANFSIFLEKLNIPHGRPPASEPEHHVAKRVREVMKWTKCKRYLEIGVMVGNSLLANPMPFRVGVDPKIYFDTRTCESPDLQLYEMTSDEYFTHYKHEEPFDVIYIDGLHQFEQVMRDFINSLSVAHDRTLWIVDDTVPCDVFSALRVQAETVRLREKETGYHSTAWHGDVFKFVFLLQAFFPMFDYFTTHQDGVNPQTIIWRSRRPFVQPACPSLSQISQLSYLDVLKHPEVFNFSTFDEGLKILEVFYQKKMPSVQG
jgi:hypothetical protein